VAVTHVAEVIYYTMKIVTGAYISTLEIILVSAILAEFQVLKWEIYIGLHFTDSRPDLAEPF